MISEKVRERSLWVFGTALSIVALLVLACGPAPAQAPTPGQASTSEPKYGGIWRVSQTVNPKSLDPHREISFNTQRLVSPSYSGILQFDPIEHTTMIPDLAERWEVSPDGKTSTFYFRKGVKWHDGKDFTAKDAEFSLLRIMDKSKGTLRPRSDWFPTVTKVEATDDFTLRVLTESPSASLLPNIASGWSLILPRHIEQQKEGTVENVVVGTGPFIFKEYTPSEGGTLVRNPNYFVQGRPYLDKIEWSVVPDSTTAFSAFRVGKLDTFGLDATNLKTVKDQMPGVVVHDTFGINGLTLRLNQARKPFDDVRVRRALSLAINRQEIIQAITQGLAVPSAPIYPGSAFTLPQEEVSKLPGYRQPKDQDIAEAKKLLAEAGYTSGFKISCTGGHGTSQDKAALVIIEQLKAVGIEMEHRILEYGALLDNYNKRDFNCGTYSGGRNSDEPDAQLVAYRCGSGWNYFNLCDEKLQQLLDQQSSTVDEAKRKAILKEAQLRLLDIVPEVFIYYGTGKAGVQPWVRNYKPADVSYNVVKMQDVWMENQPQQRQ